MGLKNILLGYAAYINNLNFNENLNIAREAAKQDGCDITFEGMFSQGLKKQRTQFKIKMPFVVAQNGEQIIKLEQGILEGKVYDSGRFANIKGHINSESVYFDKEYDRASIENPELEKKKIKDIGKGLGIETDEDSLINTHTINYKGKRVKTGCAIPAKMVKDSSNVRFEGTWKFNSRDKNYITPPAKMVKDSSNVRFEGTWKFNSRDKFLKSQGKFYMTATNPKILKYFNKR